jgi:ElaB/YqjD/DUF883 family membrane-anchored ribosome-binding protein
MLIKECFSKDFYKRLEQILETAGERMRFFRRRWEKALEDYEWYVRYNPKKAMAISAGVGAALGLFIGLVMTRRKR